MPQPLDDPSLRDIRLFVASVQQGSLSAGSRVFNLSANAASVAVKRLEELLDVQLILRTPRSISTTDEGRVFFEQCTSLLEAVEATKASVGALRDELEGPVRISAPSDLGRHTLMPVLDAFAASHPGLQLDLWLSDHVHDIVDARIDVAIRYGAQPDSELMARVIFRDRRVAVASPAYVERRGRPSHPNALAEHDILLWHRPGRTLDHWTLFQGAAPHTVEVRASRSSNDGVVLREWALAGHGIAFKAWLDVAQDLASGALVDVLPDWRGEPMPLYLMLPGRGPRPARVQRLTAALVEAFAGLETLSKD